MAVVVEPGPTLVDDARSGTRPVDSTSFFDSWTAQESVGLDTSPLSSHLPHSTSESPTEAPPGPKRLVSTGRSTRDNCRCDVYSFGSRAPKLRLVPLIASTVKDGAW